MKLTQQIQEMGRAHELMMGDWLEEKAAMDGK